MTFRLWAMVGYFSLVISAHSGTSETREVLLLDGVWNCYCEQEGSQLAYKQQGGLRRLEGIVKMPLPGSLIDFTVQLDPKSCLGVVWYERSFFVPTSWRHDRKIWLQLDGVSTGTELWINGQTIAKLNKSYVPIEREVTEYLVFDSENRIALAVDRRSGLSIPQSVSLRSAPEMLFIQSVFVNTTVVNGTAFIRYKVVADGLLQLNRKCISVQAFEADCTPVAKNTVCGNLEGTLSIVDCRLWWPMCMDSKAGYLYTLVFKLYYKYCDSVVRDVYRQKIGIRTLSWSNNSLLVNGKSFHLQGAETNEEWADVALLRWLNANALATMLAPSEKVLNLADELGLVIILGSPKSALQDVITRYRSHPSVLMWSLAVGESWNSTEWARYYDSLIDFGRKHLDGSRPYAASISLSDGSNHMVNKFDIITLNLQDANSRNSLTSNSSVFLKDTIEQFQKPVIIMYGNKFLSTNGKIRTLNYDHYAEFDDIQRSFDNITKNVSIVGEFFGNLVAYEQFKDEGFTLVDGIFNRNREPTTSSDFIRSKFRERTSSCACRAQECRFINKRRRRG